MHTKTSNKIYLSYRNRIISVVCLFAKLILFFCELILTLHLTLQCSWLMYIVYVIVQCMCGVRSEKLALNSETTKQRNSANKLLKNGCFFSLS